MENSRVCPNCKETMYKENINWIIIDKCPNCQWVFLDHWEMKEYIESIVRDKEYESIKKWDFKKDHEQENIVCANCWEIMEEREYIYGSWNHINFCTNCLSIYLDKWELDDIREYEISRIESPEWKKLLMEIEMKARFASKEQNEIMSQIWEKDTVMSKVFSGIKSLWYKIFK